MALIHLDFHSDALKMAVNADIILPQASRSQIGMEGKREESYRTLYLLHGLSDDHTIWQRRTSVERYAARYGVAVVMPSGGRSFYTDMRHGGAYYTYIAKELPAVCRSFFAGMSASPADQYIAGLSMGGYGAWKIAMREGNFAGAASFSGALDVYRLASHTALDDRTYWEDIFGDVEGILGSQEDAYALTEAAHRAGKLPKKLYLSCGTEDSLLRDTRRMRDLLTEKNIPCEYREATGNHNWEFWDAELERAMAYFFA